jgi:hypothetical protein
MSRREIALLVSRAIAAYYFVSATLDLLFSIPNALFLLSRTASMKQWAPYRGTPVALIPWIGILIPLGRIALLFAVATLFYKCGPLIERFLLPSLASAEEPGGIH